MKEYVKPELTIDLFEGDNAIICVIGDSEENEEISWYRPEYDDD